MEDFRFTWRELRWWASLRQVALHVVLTALAVGIAFSLPNAARYILCQWWPLVASDASLLMASEISLAASLVALFNMWRLASEDRVKARVADTAALVYARHPRFDFDTRELVYTDENGRELRRTRFPRPADGTPALLQAETPVSPSRVSGGRLPECAAARA
jgi:hypothetical protein